MRPRKKQSGNCRSADCGFYGDSETCDRRESSGGSDYGDYGEDVLPDPVLYGDFSGIGGKPGLGGDRFDENSFFESSFGERSFDGSDCDDGEEDFEDDDGEDECGDEDGDGFDDGKEEDAFGS